MKSPEQIRERLEYMRRRQEEYGERFERKIEELEWVLDG